MGMILILVKDKEKNNGQGWLIDVHVNRKYRNLCMPRLRYNAIRETDEQTKAAIANNHFPLINIYFFRCSVCYIV